LKKLFYIFIFCLAKFSLVAQITDSVYYGSHYRRGLKYEVRTTQNTVSGFLIRETATTVVIEDRRENHIHEILKSTIVSMKPVADSRVLRDDLLGENYHAHTYLFSSSSLVYEDAVSYVNYQWFLCENINYGLTKNWQITVNTIFLYPVSIGVKSNYEIAPDLYLGGNVFVVGNMSDRVAPALFFGYGASARVTQGTPNKNFSLSAGVVGLNPDLFGSTSSSAFLNLPYANISYANRFHERWALCLEGWYFPQIQVGFGGVGFKFLKSQETSWTVGCFTYINTINNQVTPNFKALPIPYLGVTSNLFGH
jgi:hypothetical protein